MKELISIINACLMFLNIGIAKAPVEYSAWIPWWDENRAIQSIEASSEILDHAMPGWYKINDQAVLERIDSKESQKIKQMLDDRGVEIMPSIFNDFDAKRITLILQDKNLENKFLESLISIAKENGYSGWDIDFEQVDNKDKDGFSNLVELMASKLHDNDLKLSVSVHARTGGSTDSQASQSMDYKALSNSADLIRVMAYDYHHSASAAGPITPIDWLEKVIDYSLENIDRKKLVIALPLYGYEWSTDSTKSVLYQDVVKSGNFTAFVRDTASHVLNANIDLSKTWVEDAESVIEKIQIARNKGINKFSFWKLGGEDLSLWEKLNSS